MFYVSQIRKILEGKQPDCLRLFASEYMTSPLTYEDHSTLQPPYHMKLLIHNLMEGGVYETLAEQSKPIDSKYL